MSNHIYKSIELTGTSTVSIEDAVNSAIEKAAATVHNIRWFEILETRGTVNANQVAQWQVTFKLGFTLD